MVARLAASVVAVRPPAGPVGNGAPLSARSAEVRPLPEPICSARVTVPAGAVQLVVVDDLSAQYDTSHDPAALTFTVGVTCAVTDVASDR